MGFGCSLVDVGYMIVMALNPTDRRKYEVQLHRQHWESLCTSKHVNAETYTEEISFLLYKIFAATKMFYLIDLMSNLMADGRLDDVYIPGLVMTRLTDFVDDHGTPKENYNRVLSLLGEELLK